MGEFEDILNMITKAVTVGLPTVMYVVPVIGCCYLSYSKGNKYYKEERDNESDWLSYKYFVAAVIPVLNILVMLRGIIFKK